VSMVAMTPLITIQVLGLIYKLRSKSAQEPVPVQPVAVDEDDDDIIEIKEVEYHE